MRNPDDGPAPLAKVIDFEKARARRVEALAPPPVPRQAREPAQDEAGERDHGPAGLSPSAEVTAGAAEQRRQRDRAAQRRRRLQERTAQTRAAAAKHRIQLRVADRLARVEAELEAEIARLRLLYAERRRRQGSGLWMWPTVAMSLLALVAGFAYFAGTQRMHALAGRKAGPPLAWKSHQQLTVRAQRPRTRLKGRRRAAQSAPAPSSGGSTSGTPYKPALPASGPGCGGTPYRSMSPASGSTGGTP